MLGRKDQIGKRQKYEIGKINRGAQKLKHKAQIHYQEPKSKKPTIGA